MKSTIHEIQFAFVKDYDFIKPDMQKVDSITNSCISDCQNEHFHRFENKCVLNFQLKKIADNEIVHFTIADKEMNWYEVNKNF